MINFRGLDHEKRCIWCWKQLGCERNQRSRWHFAWLKGCAARGRLQQALLIEFIQRRRAAWNSCHFSKQHWQQVWTCRTNKIYTTNISEVLYSNPICRSSGTQASEVWSQKKWPWNGTHVPCKHVFSMIYEGMSLNFPFQMAIPDRNKNNTSTPNPKTSTMPTPYMTWPMSVSRKVFRTLTGEGYSMSGRPDKPGMTLKNPSRQRESPPASWKKSGWSRYL